MFASPLNILNIEINVELVFHHLLGVFLERCDSLVILVCDSLPPNNHDCNDWFFKFDGENGVGLVDFPLTTRYLPPEV